MLIPKSERSPRYFGAVVKECGQTSVWNPYSRDDKRFTEWLKGYTNGVLYGPKEKK